jgi:hypothetical protein
MGRSDGRFMEELMVIPAQSCTYNVRCATNNTAATVLSAFRTVVELFGATKGEIRSGWGEY